MWVCVCVSVCARVYVRVYSSTHTSLHTCTPHMHDYRYKAGNTFNSRTNAKAGGDLFLFFWGRKEKGGGQIIIISADCVHSYTYSYLHAIHNMQSGTLHYSTCMQRRESCHSHYPTCIHTMYMLVCMQTHVVWSYCRTRLLLVHAIQTRVMSQSHMHESCHSRT